MVKYIRMYYDVIDRGSLLQLQINVSSDVEHYTYSIMMECKKFNSMTFQPQSFLSGAKRALHPTKTFAVKMLHNCNLLHSFIMLYEMLNITTDRYTRS